MSVSKPLTRAGPMGDKPFRSNLKFDSVKSSGTAKQIYRGILDPEKGFPDALSSKYVHICVRTVCILKLA
jgi:hypothetical protein